MRSSTPGTASRMMRRNASATFARSGAHSSGASSAIGPRIPAGAPTTGNLPHDEDDRHERDDEAEGLDAEGDEPERVAPRVHERLDQHIAAGVLSDEGRTLAHRHVDGAQRDVRP